KTIDFPLPTGRYYEFSITPFFNDFNEVGQVVATTGARLFLPDPPVLPPSYYQVENFNASVSLNGGGATLQWTNPANFSDTSINSLLTVVDGYVNATAVEKLPNSVSLGVNQLINLDPGLTTVDLPLPAGNYYEFSIIPRFYDNDEVGLLVATTGPRLLIPAIPPVLPPSYYQVENFNVAVSINGGGATLQWTNPANFSGTSIISLLIEAEGYANATATETLSNPGYFIVNEAGNLTQGTKTIDFPLPTGRYYEFSITPFFTDVYEVGQAVATTAPRLFIPDLLPVLPPPIYYQVDNFRVTPGANAATLEWTNPFNIDSTSITSFNITIRSYADATGNGEQQDSLILIGSEEYLSSGNKTFDTPLIAALGNRYYEFFIIPTFRDFSEKGVIVKAAGPRILITDDATDSDRDGIMDAQDVDDDADGLIDIYTAEQFDLIRNNLAGRAFSDTPGEYGSDIGCGNGKTVIYCNGYELMNNISLSNYVNWEPIGTSQDKYKAIFEGNGNTISNISISFATTDSVGLFSSLASNNKIFNLHLHQVEISVSTNLVGALAGDSTGAFIRNVAISNISISGGSQVGGLLGNLNGGRLYNSSVIGGSVFAANSDAGGLVGSSQGGDIDDTLARLHEIVATTQNAGGLIGFYDGSNTLEINSTYAQAGLIDTGTNTGGILGYASGPAGLVQIGYAYAQIGTLRSSISNSASIIGGHADNSNVSITNSYGVVGIIDNPRPESVGGLASNIINLNVNNSYWDNSVTLINGAITSAGRRTGEQTTAALQTGAGDIFSDWLSKLWDFGEDTEYPALHNLAGSTPAEQRYFVIRRDNP
ncbi:MAG: hypothetical protein K0U41_02590, partial [Gammaproteobacteria bacterium]|nr:hypothetical protein [Gammaproteobacteria bacterium]